MMVWVTQPIINKTTLLFRPEAQGIIASRATRVSKTQPEMMGSYGQIVACTQDPVLQVT